ncbi:hypothetical protein HT749_37570 [Burkholderia cepacia]|uniref:hypothetical protein n=1 Tax=Burkholderia cepacia TaxID=292 RepID=UPI00157A713C|nr:hypothetical protein [Burkholderia cepacia]NTX49100.1 hypothetical protein [Burkholderia cepacia]
MTNIDVTLEMPDVSSDEWRRVDCRVSILPGHVDIASQKKFDRDNRVDIRVFTDASFSLL